MTKGKILFWGLVWMLQVMLVGVVLPSGWLEDQVMAEREMTRDWLGDTTLEKLVDDADSIFRTNFEETGMVEASFAVIPTEQERNQSKGIEDMGSSLWPFVEGRLKVFWITVYQGVQRISMFSLWLPYLLPLFIPALVHGWCIREIKKVSYGYASPVVYHSAAHGVVALAFMPLFYITIPFGVHPAFVLGWAVMLSLVLVALLANVQKQI